VAIPSLAVMTLVYIFAALQGYNRAITPSLDRLECITGTPFLPATVDIDSYARISMEPMKDKKRGTNEYATSYMANQTTSKKMD
jgi:hypothetical protein